MTDSWRSFVTKNPYLKILQPANYCCGIPERRRGDPDPGSRGEEVGSSSSRTSAAIASGPPPALQLLPRRLKMKIIGCFCSCCCMLTWVVEELLTYRLHSMHCREILLESRHYADPLTSLELLNYYLIPAVSSGRFSILCHLTYCIVSYNTK